MPDVGNGAERWDVVVAGAGIAGMAAAQVLVDAGLKVMVVEKAGAPGGKCMSYVDPELGFTIEHGIHGVFPRYLNLRKLWADAGIPASIFSTTKTTGMAGADKRMHVTELARAHGPAPFFLLGLVPSGVLRLRDFLFSSRFLLRTYAAATSGVRDLDDTTFGALLRGTGVSTRIKQVLLLPYVRNLTYARGDEVSAQVAVEALSYYVVEDSESVKAHWIDGGPSQVIFSPWQQELERRGVKFLFKTPVQSIAMRGNQFSALVSREVISDKELGPSTRVWTQQLGHHYLGLRWQPDKRRLTALNAICTHRGCPVKVNTDGAEPHYQCPCHGAQYDLDGKVLNPPATQPLPDVPMHHDEASGVWYVEGDGSDASGSAEGGSYAADFAVIAMDLPGVQQVLPKELLLDQATAGIPLLHTTSVMVLRMCFAARPGKPKWNGPDSGVFTADDLLDNFFAPHTFQKEFAQREELILECHIGDSERIDGLDDASVFAQALEVLKAYFPEEDLATRFQAQRSRLLRHDDVFTLCAPGDLSRTPTVSSEARPNLMFAGDWVQTDDPSHRSFFMERAAVTGIEAANAVLKRKGLVAKQRALECAQPPAVARVLGFPNRFLMAMRSGVRRLCGVD